MKSVKRGDIFWFNFGINSGSVQNGHRPALVIQADNFNANSTTTVIATITSGQKGLHLPSHIYLGDRYGLSQPSTVMLEQIRTINQDELDDYIGTVNDKPTLRALEIGIKKTFGLWVYGTNKDDVRCLCPKCVNEYMNSGSFRISRLDPFQKVKEPCDRCNRPGYDYVLRFRHSK